MNAQQRQQAVAALKSANAAGNTEAAQQIAAALTGQQSSGGQPLPRRMQPPPIQPVPVQPVPEDQQAGPVGGVLDAALTAGSAALAQPISGLLGLAQMAQNAIPGDEQQDYPPAKTVEYWQRYLTREPQTKTGQEYLQAASLPAELYENYIAEPAGEAALSVTGSPAAATAVETGLVAAPSAIGGLLSPRFRPSAAAARKADVASVDRAANQFGVNTHAKPAEQLEQIQAGANANSAATQGEAMPQLINAVSAKRREALKNRNEKYRQARTESGAGLDRDLVNELYQESRAAMRNEFALHRMPKIQKELNELKQVQKMPEGTVIKLKALEDWRKGLGESAPADATTSQSQAITRLRGIYDDFIQQQFMDDMLSGDPEAVSRWKQARASSKQFNDLYRSDKAVKKIESDDLDATEARRLILGANAVNAKAGAANTVQSLKKILGEDSPHFRALRSE